MAIASGVWAKTLADILDANHTAAFDWTADTISVDVVVSTITPDFTETTGYAITDYAASIVEDSAVDIPQENLAATPTVNATDNVGFVVYDAPDVVFSNISTDTDIAGCLIWNETTATPTADPLFICVDFGATYPVNTGDFTITWTAPASGGIMQIDCTP